jgi:hypothetical protein
MPEPHQAGPPPNVPARLQELARLLRDADHLEPVAQQSLADLTDELARALGSTKVPSAEEVQLGQLTAQLVEALHRQDKPGPLAGRLHDAILAAEVRAPFAAGLARQVLDVLANLGI